MTNSEPSKREVAVHESGHAVAAYLAFQGRSPLMRCDEPMFESVTVVSERDAFGHCETSEEFDRENRYSKSRDWLKAATAVFKAGRKADILVNGKKQPEDWYKNDDAQVEFLFCSNSPFNKNKVVEEAELWVTNWFKTIPVLNAIDQLANELERGRTLEWNECERIIKNRLIS